MKTLILTLLLGLPIMAQADIRPGLFQVDPSLSKVTLLDQSQRMTGFIEITPTSSDSRIKVESEDISFESTSISLHENDELQVKGILTYQGIPREVTIHGHLTEKQRLTFFLRHETFSMRIMASRPDTASVALYKEVQEIVE